MNRSFPEGVDMSLGAARTSAYAPLLLNRRAVAFADFAPAAVQLAALAALAARAERVLRRGLLVDLHAPARRFIRVQVSVLHDRAALENFLRALVERRVLLHAEAVADDIERHVRAVSDGGHIAGTMPGRAHVVDLAESGDLAARGQPAGLGNVDADVVDEPLGDKRRPLVRAVEQLAHGERGGALLADHAEVCDIFG